MSSSTPSEAEVARPSTWIGRIIDERYRVEELLGEGGMGSVYVAEHLKLRKRVAFKVIHPEIAGDGEVAARFAREAMASAQLDHPHVASALDFGALPEGGAYLVMQLVPGPSLQALIDTDGATPWGQACEIGAQIADALTAAHAAGIIHRDLKPDNVLLEPRDDGSTLVKVLDFGIARVAMEEGAAPAGAQPGKALTRVGTVIGTPGYMSPEQAMGEAVDERADLYALGVVLWEMVAGRSMFETRDLTAIVTQQLTVDPPSLRTVSSDPSIPDALEHLVAALLAREPGNRPDKAGAVRDILRQLAFSVSGMGSITGIQALAPPLPAPRDDGTAHTILAGSEARPSGARPAVVGPGPTTLIRRLATAVTAQVQHVPGRTAALGCGALVLLLLAGGAAVIALGGEDEAPGGGKPSGAFSLNDLIPQQVTELTEPTPPPEVQERIDDLIRGNRSQARRRAARWLMDHEPASQVPDYARLGAELTVAAGCRRKKDVLARIVELDDGRLRPVVMRLHRSGRSSGFLGMGGDRYACMRAELASAVEDLPDLGDGDDAEEEDGTGDDGS